MSNETTAWELDGPELRRAMRAARSVLRERGDLERGTRTCRLTAGNAGALVWASDGYRVLRLAVRGRGSAAIDAALPRAAVLALCTGADKTVTVKSVPGGTEVTDGNGRTTRYESPRGISRAGLEAALGNGERTGAVRIRIERKEAGAALRKAGIGAREVCRAEIGANGLALWTTGDYEVGDEEPAARAAPDATDACAHAIVLGMRGRDLVETLEGLRGEQARIEAVARSMPVRIETAKGTATLAAARLSGDHRRDECR